MAAEALGTRSDTQTLDRLSPLAAELSDVFTTGRSAGFSNYAASRDHWLAYGAFFFPQTFIRMRFVLEECLTGGRWRPRPGNDPLRVLDLGAGTGAATFAAAATLGPRLGGRPIEMTAIDASEAALSLLRALHGNCGPCAGFSLTTRAGSIRDFAPTRGDASPDVILVCFALNEVLEAAAIAAAERWLRDALARLAPGGLLVMLEPALHAACERMERLRDAVSAQRLARVAAPCPHHLPCPMLRMPEIWCHDVRRWRVPESVEYINRRLQRSVQDLKHCFIALVKEPAPEPDPRGIGYCRVVAPIADPRGRLCTFGCGADGAIHPYEVQTRDLTHEAKRLARDIERGTRMEWRDARLLGDGRTVRGVPQVRRAGSR
jgi:SAM-dependent methyltransferase